MFILFASLLVLIALLFVLPPLIGKAGADTNDPQQANLDASRQRLDDLERDANNDLVASNQLKPLREEAETTLLLELDSSLSQSQSKTNMSSRFHLVCTLLVSLSVPVIAFGVYLMVGTPMALDQVATNSSSDETGQNLEEMLGKLEQRLVEQPGDEQGWLILAQTNMIMARYPQAVAAMEQLHKLTGDTPDVLSRYADALFMASGGRFNDKATAMTAKALELDSEHIHALWLSGIQAYQNENFATAVEFFNRARSGITDAENLAQLDELTRLAVERGNLQVDLPVSPDDPAIPAINVSVQLDSALASMAEPDDALFVFARAAEGPPMPLAVARLKASDLPVTVSLDDSMAMMPELKLSGFDKVIISARISGSGQPIAQKGDLQGESGIVEPGKVTRVEVRIDQVVD